MSEYDATTNDADEVPRYTAQGVELYVPEVADDRHPLARIYRSLESYRRDLSRRIRVATRLLARGAVPPSQEEVLIDMEQALSGVDDLIEVLEPVAHMSGHELVNGDVDLRKLNFALEGYFGLDESDLANAGRDHFLPVRSAAIASLDAIDRQLDITRGGPSHGL